MPRPSRHSDAALLRVASYAAVDAARRAYVEALSCAVLAGVSRSALAQHHEETYFPGTLRLDPPEEKRAGPAYSG